MSIDLIKLFTFCGVRDACRIIHFDCQQEHTKLPVQLNKKMASVNMKGIRILFEI